MASKPVREEEGFRNSNRVRCSGRIITKTNGAHDLQTRSPCCLESE